MAEVPFEAGLGAGLPRMGASVPILSGPADPPDQPRREISERPVSDEPRLEADAGNVDGGCRFGLPWLETIGQHDVAGVRTIAKTLRQLARVETRRARETKREVSKRIDAAVDPLLAHEPRIGEQALRGHAERNDLPASIEKPSSHRGSDRLRGARLEMRFETRFGGRLELCDPDQGAGEKQRHACDGDARPPTDPVRGDATGVRRRLLAHGAARSGSTSGAIGIGSKRVGIAIHGDSSVSEDVSGASSAASIAFRRSGCTDAAISACIRASEDS